MKTFSELHNDAMFKASLAELAKRRGDAIAAQALLREALELESRAAQIASTQATEPTRSVLLRSAATLAIDCDEPREAERLIALALTGNPPEEIANELRDLLSDCR